jgi:antitoxin (DNA-binding transcriptional repressor) of toxin-antitoxin stability system
MCYAVVVKRIGVRELRQNASRYLALVKETVRR